MKLYYMFKKFLPILYIRLLFKIGQDFMGMQYDVSSSMLEGKIQFEAWQLLFSTLRKSYRLSLNILVGTAAEIKSKIKITCKKYEKGKKMHKKAW